MTSRQGNRGSSSLEAARAVKDKARTMVATIAEVQGVGITRVDGIYAVMVNVLQELEDESALPESIDGVPLVIKVTGTIRKQ